VSFKFKTKAALATVALACFAAGAIITAMLGLVPRGSAESKPSADLEALRRIGQGFSQVAKEVSPSVVNVRGSKTVEVDKSPFGGRSFDFFGESPFGRFFEGPPAGEDYVRKRSGSGVIVSEDGYILTNNQVVEGANEITVVKADGDKYDAKVVGTDPPTGVAVIKVEGRNFPAAKLGDSDKIEVGEWVLAIGNPFELQNTVTAGIISGRGRSKVGLADYEDFIQTDAAINLGNSGGPLVNLDGEVIGINTGVATGSGDNMSIGFAVPINMAKQVMEQLIKTGKVTRGWLGVYIQPITPGLKEKFNLKSTEGALVADVDENGPAKKAGIELGDVIVEFRGEKIKDTSHLRNLVAATGVGTEAVVKVIRDGREKTLKVKIAELPEKAAAGRRFGGSAEKDLGFNVIDLTPRLRDQLGLPETQTGVVVSDIKQTSDAYQQGLLKGDVIVEINRARVTSVGDFNNIMARVSAGDEVLLLVITQGHTRYVTFKVEK
jgi:serine protease Do